MVRGYMLLALHENYLTYVVPVLNGVICSCSNVPVSAGTGVGAAPR